MSNHVIFEGHSGNRLVADVCGRWSGPAVVLLHGAGQTRHSWGKAAAVLADQGCFAVRLDARGHGDSDWDPAGDYSYESFADDLRAVIRQLGRPVALVGASLGGMTSLLAAGDAPAVDCTALVLVDITPRGNEAGRDHVRQFMRANPDGFASVEEAAAAVTAYLPDRPRPADPSGLRKNLRLREDGRYHWHWDPAIMAGNGSSRSIAHSHADRMEEVARQVSAPVLLVRGARSDVVTEADAAAFQRLMPKAEQVDVAGAAHMVAGDRNDRFNHAVLDFLKRRLHLSAH